MRLTIVYFITVYLLDLTNAYLSSKIASAICT